MRCPSGRVAVSYADRERENQLMPLTLDELAALTDTDIQTRIFRDLVHHVHDAGASDARFERVRRLSPGQRMVWGTLILDGEVNNGGFNQFFFNASGQYAVEAIDGFRLLGADEHAILVEEAIALFFEEVEKLRPFWSPRTLEGFAESYKHTDSGQLDQRYYELPDVTPLRVAYIRRHLAEFASQPDNGPRSWLRLSQRRSRRRPNGG